MAIRYCSALVDYAGGGAINPWDSKRQCYVKPLHDLALPTRHGHIAFLQRVYRSPRMKYTGAHASAAGDPAKSLICAAEIDAQILMLCRSH